MVSPSANWSSSSTSGTTIPCQSATAQLYGETRACFLRVTGVEWPKSRWRATHPRRARMTTADQALSREGKRGVTREGVRRRAAGLGIVVSAGTLGPLTDAAFAETQIKRGGSFRQATSGGNNDFIDGEDIVENSDNATLI